MTIGSLDYRIFHAVDEFAGDYKWLAHATYVFETIGVVLYAAAVVVLWLATEPGEERRWKIAGRLTRRVANEAEVDNADLDPGSRVATGLPCTRVGSRNTFVRDSVGDQPDGRAAEAAFSVRRATCGSEPASGLLHQRHHGSYSQRLGEATLLDNVLA